MDFLHNTYLKRLASRIFETNGDDAPIEKVSNFVQPVYDLKPIINVSKYNTTSYDTPVTIYTTPSNSDFYLMGLSFAGNYNMVFGNTYIAVTNQDGEIVQFQSYLSSTGSGAPLVINFGETGLLLKRGTSITLYTSCDDAHGTIWGSVQSDRSGG